CARDQSGYDNW
nr:immunoglobulin heavy chain junction region [Macaca mulatta]